ncbi:MAG: tRNA preQ1(34) S-adenosylmethionine ribosyltransferase-isomerase QueA [Nitrospirae bacterium]|nr:tRNA preQ1(34) S-adenosylmethionine ribosyltransferase-isomerase QueA [Nitrospirota bacterium]
MKLSDFDYLFPERLIAQHPPQARDSSRLLILDRKNEAFEHRIFRNLPEYLFSGDLLIINDTKVIPARIKGEKASGKTVDILLVKELEINTWQVLIKGRAKGKVRLSGGIIAELSDSDGIVIAKFSAEDENLTEAEIKEELFKAGKPPLPFYIKREAAGPDSERYQTVFAQKEGAIAAPTAGLHFTEELLSKLKNKGVDIKLVTLHVGYGTFKPVTSEDITEHKMGEEEYEISEETADAIRTAQREGRRIIAVGTTVTRALESSAAFNDGRVSVGEGKASIFIYPGYKFKVINALITNFHLPRSTPMMLTSAFTGLTLLKKAYAESIKEGYRFFSYGDSMFIV